VDELDNCVDIDDYYRRIGLPTGDHDAAELRHAVVRRYEGASQQLSGSIGGQRRYTWARASPAAGGRGSGGLDRVDALDGAGLQPLGFSDPETRRLDEG
jgi:hypothetical protein